MCMVAKSDPELTWLFVVLIELSATMEVFSIRAAKTWQPLATWAW